MIAPLTSRIPSQALLVLLHPGSEPKSATPACPKSVRPPVVMQRIFSIRLDHIRRIVTRVLVHVHIHIGVHRLIGV